MTIAPLLLTMTSTFLLLGAAPDAEPADDPTEEIVALEKAMLDRWGTGDTYSFIEAAAPEVTYFEPELDKRLDGAEALEKLLAPFKDTFRVFRYEMIGPKVQAHGDVAVLTYNLIDYEESGKETERWNTTEVYCRLDGKWKLIHSHYSLTKCGVK
ncbi:MAG: nuclear transport factor 2 family protein [Acidobacteriota bacterium]